MHSESFVDGLLDFVRRSPTPYHAVQISRSILEQAGFQHLPEDEPWPTAPLGSYYVARADSSLIAFTRNRVDSPFHMAGAHTDSPCLKVKPQPDIHSQDCGQVGIEVYGGALLNPWFDRDLSLAGRICWQDDQEKLRVSLIDFKRPIAIIPSLAIHLDREANQNRTINKQTDLQPILLGATKDKMSFSEALLQEVQSLHPMARRILDFDLLFYDCQTPARIGLRGDMVSGARLDNLASCYILVQALCSQQSQNSLIVLNDHEEIGSVSDLGAQGPFLQQVLERLLPVPEDRHRLCRQSFFLSLDNAHATHPNQAAKHDPQHLVRLNGGPVIKQNANQRYMTSSVNTSRIRSLCHSLDIPTQEFVMRNDLACGSTIGPVTAATTGIPTMDMGLPSLAMHSIRETMGSEDCHHMCRLLTQYFAQTTLPQPSWT